MTSVKDQETRESPEEILSDDLQNIIKILNFTTSQRSEKHSSLLQDFTKSINFFQKLINDHGSVVHKAACERLTYEHINSGEHVFIINSFANKFYIILKGTVSVWVSDSDYDLVKVNTLSDGASFGELALIKDQPRSASILCEESTHLAVLSKDDYMNIIGRIESRKLECFINFLHDIPVFSRWSKKQLELLTLFINKQSFKRKQDVFRVKDPAKFVFIVFDGEFELCKQMDQKKRQNFNIKIALLSRGEIFGFEEVIANESYKYNCSCYSTTGILLVVKAEDFKMKVNSEEFISEFRKNDLSKSSLRCQRLEGFKLYLNESLKIENEKSSNEKSPCKPKNISPGPIKPNFKSIIFNIKDLERIRKKALGRPHFAEKKSDRIANSSILLKSFHSFKTDQLNELNRSSETRPKSSMKYHRPGGYFVARLKKSWKGLKHLKN